ncbi:MAG TPA: DNA recombination protein RmuC [Gammaproteobacteria bacterium]|nr:DNA recombination protein RmuC [Gammaproteobacteria bacterium]
MDSIQYLYLYIGMALAGGFAAGFALAWLRGYRYKIELEAQRQSSLKMADSFAALSSRALRENNEIFIRLAEENLQKHQMAARSELDKKEKSIENLLKPIRETLEKTEKQMHEIEKERKQAYGSLQQHLHQMTETQIRLQQETRNLVSALRRPEVRGQWGEMTLKRLAELAGLVEYCDFYEQETISTESGSMRPDMIVRMPDRRELVIDAKTPLDAYLTAVQCTDEQQKLTELQRHARKLRERVKELAAKAYWSQFKQSPDFVVLFIPGEQFLSAALEHDPQLLEYALANKVILATPTSLIALLRAVAFGWRQQAVAKNAEQIQSLGAELYNRMQAFIEHLDKLGNSLGNSIEHYNRAVGSLERSVLPGARRFAELGIETRKEIGVLEQIEKSPRKTEK